MQVKSRVKSTISQPTMQDIDTDRAKIISLRSTTQSPSEGWETNRLHYCIAHFLAPTALVTRPMVSTPTVDKLQVTHSFPLWAGEYEEKQ